MTERIKSDPNGRLAVNIKTDSMFLGQAVPIEVRDSNLRLVKRSSRGESLDVPAGLYEVSAVLEDGRRHSSLVQVAPGKQTLVNLLAEPDNQTQSHQAMTLEHPLPQLQWPRFTRNMAIRAETDAADEFESAINVQLLEVEGAELARETPTLRIFRCAAAIETVPSALFQVDDRQLRISLPVSPNHRTPSGGCAVKFEQTATGLHAHAWISPERTVANALQNMLISGYVIEAARVADDAVELLRSKYEDPTGATLGALILYKTGGLRRWESWVENLEHDFPWLPDGKVLLAMLRYESDATSNEALGLALAACKQRMLYAESYSLLLDLLRRWPGEVSLHARHEAISQLASNSPYVDWESVCLSQWTPTPGE